MKQNCTTAFNHLKKEHVDASEGYKSDFVLKIDTWRICWQLSIKINLFTDRWGHQRWREISPNP